MDASEQNISFAYRRIYTVYICLLRLEVFMDYSKRGIEQKQHYIKSTSRRLVSKTRITLFRLLIVLVVSVGIIGTFAGFGLIKGLIDSAPDISKINVVPTGYTTTVYDKDGNVIENLIGAEANRVYVSLSDLPEWVKYSFIAIEDERFYEHNGIDVRGILRAGVLGLTSGSFNQGGSTITQQLLKNQVFNGGREATFVERLKRKIQEQYLAIQLENRLDKDTILEYYLNTINLGSGTLGIQTASRKYFNKDAKDLTLSEAATIAAIAQLPVYHNPITHPERNAVRRQEILDEMLKQGHCTQEEYDEAVADDVYSRVQSINEEQDSTSYYSYFTDELIEQVMEDLQTKLGYTQAQASNLLFSGGLSIYTTQDSTIQSICDDVFSDEKNFPEMGVSFWELTYALSVQKDDEKKTTIHYNGNDLLEYFKDFKDPDHLYVDDKGSKFSLLFLDKEDMRKKIAEFRDAMVEDGDTILGENITMTIQPQTSFVVMDQHTGEVVAIEGGRGEKTGNRTLNRATNRVRQPGSTFKVLSTYLPALDSLGMTLATVQDDSGPYYYPGTKKKVKNWTSVEKYEGLSTLRQGIYNSMNIVTVKTFVEVTPQLGYDYLLKLGFTSLVDSRKEPDGRVVSDINHPMALGGLTDGVSNLELTAAYAAIANGGVYTKPRFYTKILDHDGKVLLTTEPEHNQVMKESTAFLLTNAMEDVIKKGTGKNLRLSIDMPIAGKTGSTSDYNDLWFSGFSPYYTATVWSGFDNNRSQTDKTYNRKIWKTIMERIHTEKNLETKDFEMPDSIVTAKICTKSGKLAVDGVCNEYLGGNTTKVEYFAKGTQPTEYCDIHVKASICEDSKDLATEYCPHVKEGVYLVKKETGKTADTPYIYPSDSCKLHTEKSTYQTPQQTPTQQPDEPESDDPYNEDDYYEDEPYYQDPQTNIPSTDGTGTDTTDPVYEDESLAH
jgi:penicillin-binding protein 1A